MLFSKDLPDQIAICLHSLEPANYEPFKTMVNFFKKLDYHFCDPDIFLNGDGQKKVFLSFDDNYRAWYEALDFFAALQIKCTFYINTWPIRDIATPNEIAEYFLRINHRGERKSLSAGEIQEILRRGHTIGSHTHSHLMLTSVSEEAAKHDIKLGKEYLARITESEIRHFSYPHGMRRHFNEDLRQYCLDLGFHTIANAIPGLQHIKQVAENINRSPWKLEKPFDYNLKNIRTAGHLFEFLTGRSAVG